MKLLSSLFLRYCRSPHHRGKVRLLTWIGRFFPAEGIVAPVYPDVLLYLRPRDVIEYALLTTGRYEPLTLTFLQKNLAAGENALLAGVNFGLHVTVAARAVAPAGRVIGVEPQPAALLRASRNLALNGLSADVVLLSAALGESVGFSHMPWPPPGNSGAASLLDAPDSGVTICLMPVREVLRRLAVDTLRLALLDVQGFELKALHGLADAPPPEILVVEADELFLVRAGVSVRQILERVWSLGYEIFDLHGTPLPPSTTSVDEANLVAVHRSSRGVTWV